MNGFGIAENEDVIFRKSFTTLKLYNYRIMHDITMTLLMMIVKNHDDRGKFL